MRSSEANADARTEYTEDNPYPGFRPSVSALAYKLRHLKNVQNDEAMFWVLDQWIFWRWVSKPNPDYLFRLLGKLYFYWGSALSRQELFGQSIDEVKREYLHLEPQQEALPETLSSGANGETSPEAWFTPARRATIMEMIGEHEYFPYMKKGISVPQCTCGTEFEFREQWLRHVYIRIKKAVLNAPS